MRAWVSRRIRNLWLVPFAADFLAVSAAYYATLVVRFDRTFGQEIFSEINRLLGVRPTGALGDQFRVFYFVSAPRIVLLLTAVLCVLYALHDLYPGRRFIRPRPTAWNVLRANLAALGMFFVYFYLRRNVFHPRGYFVTVLFLNVLFCVLFRGAAEALLRWLRLRFGFDRCPALLIGSGSRADFLADYVQRLQPHGIALAGREGFDAAMPCDRWLDGIEARSRELGVAMLIVAEPMLTVNQIMQILERAARLQVAVKVLSDRLDVLNEQAGQPVDMIRGVPLVHFNAPEDSRVYQSVKKGVGLLAAWPLTLVALPLMGAIAAAIALFSRGSLFFVQERIGINRIPFRMWKFRTMHSDAEEQQASVEPFNESDSGLFKMRRDPRITAVGRVLRRFSLDELPQLFNVLRGEMTFVGPRPLPWRDFRNYYEQWHYTRHEGLPGLTCLWQVSGRSEIGFQDMCVLDVYYLRNQNWILDVKILLKTFWVVLFARGAY